jgi:hypothetical protein
MQDLSMHHRPVGTLLDPQLHRDPNSLRLSPDQVNFFHERGYVSGIRVLLDEQVETLREELAELADPKHPGHEFFYERLQITFFFMR